VKRLGVDVGGTFTDLILVSDEDGTVIVDKLPTTTDDPSRGTIEGARRLIDSAGIGPEAVDQFFHGTTIATNVVLERDGALAGLITTEGFRDILHTARHRRPLTFSIQQSVPWQEHPLVQREHRLTVPERIVPPDGAIEVELDEARVREAARKLKTAEVEAVAICFLFSFLNDDHERRAARVVAEELPDAHVFLRSEVAPRYREYEAFSTTALCAYVGPRVNTYLGRLAESMREAGFGSELHLMSSAGGVATVGGATRQPVSLLMSGPVAGLIGGVWAGGLAGFDDVITLDVGGTSADIGVAPAGQIRTKHLLDTQIAGYHASIPMADIDTIGAGGGSIAFVDDTGMLHVGPQSAGAQPGPACYGRGGTQATVTDAMVALGKLRPAAFLAGAMEVKPELAIAAIERDVGAPLGLDLSRAAASIVGVVTHSMIQAIELNSVQKGYDPRDFTLVALGGAGPLFACDIGRELELSRVLVPPHPGITSALGLLATDVVYDFSTTVMQPLASIDYDRIRSEYARLEQAAREQLLRDGIPEQRIELRRFADCRYVNQGYELPVRVESSDTDDDWVATLRERFHSEHERAYSRRFSGEIQIVNMRVLGVGLMEPLTWPTIPEGDGSPAAAEIDRSTVVFAEGASIEEHETTFYSRSLLRAGDTLIGPAVIEQFDTTTIVNPGVRCVVDRFGNLVLETA
jgi:N-methylhydantoinase A/oxoprolinase/acetone carboxylase beta subunit